jgi:hypothetical protein
MKRKTANNSRNPRPRDRNLAAAPDETIVKLVDLRPLLPEQAVRPTLLQNGHPLLRSELAAGIHELVLINGSGAAHVAERSFGAQRHEVEKLTVPGRAPGSRIGTAGMRNVPAIAWSVNLQSSFGLSSELRIALNDRVRAVGDRFNCSTH